MEGRNRHVFDRFGVEAQNAEVMDGVPVDGVRIDFLMVVEYNITPERSRADNMSICKDISINVLADETPQYLLLSHLTLSQHQRQIQWLHWRMQHPCRRNRSDKNE